MPPFVLIILLLIAGTFCVEEFVLFPLELIRNFSLPSSLTMALLVVVVAWCFGE